MKKHKSSLAMLSLYMRSGGSQCSYEEVLHSIHKEIIFQKTIFNRSTYFLPISIIYEIVFSKDKVCFKCLYSVLKNNFTKYFKKESL